MSSIFIKILNATFLIRYTFQCRLIAGVLFYMIGFILIYFGFLMKHFVLICLSAICMGSGAVLTVLAILGFMKYYPSHYFAIFLAGNISGGLPLTALYLVCSYNDIKVYNVGIFQTFVLFCRYKSLYILTYSLSWLSFLCFCFSDTCSLECSISTKKS